ncbi:DUF916 and DUF3324 domain-containing protein [Xylocopilactobacillus apicola]|uniref:Cell surface protein n=1 Tax=Xylocopilactobacillus apicola TaxID=2932184 RepID=A0AAU9D5H8_9LACO|nr:DUF916 and DUF3324 domain-containing protein [Xylocopilactobacillus apicola]BDR59049.1 cell surface protein [Xylocopilactobacillus apicola]
MRAIKKFILACLILVHILAPSQVKAAENPNSDFFVHPQLSEKQLRGVSDFFDVLMEPQETHTLQLNVYNNADQVKDFSIQLENTITNDFGVIEYLHNAKEYDKTLRYKFTDLAISDSTVTVPAKGSAPVSIKVKMPNEKLDGIILGGVRVSGKSSDQKKIGKSSGITNVFSYVIPVKLRQNTKEVPNKLNFLSVKVGKQNYSNVVKVRLQNPQPEILRDLTLTATIYDESGKKEVYPPQTNELKLAPNSNFDYAVSLGDGKIKAGKYFVKLNAKAKELDKEWKKPFQITEARAKEFNDDFALKEGTPSHISTLTIVILLLVIILLSLTIYVIFLQIRKKKAKHLIFWLLIGSALSLATLDNQVYAENVSEATIQLIPMDEKNVKKKETKQDLPATGERHSVINSVAGWFLIGAAGFLIKKREIKK